MIKILNFLYKFQSLIRRDCLNKLEHIAHFPNGLVEITYMKRDTELKIVSSYKGQSLMAYVIAKFFQGGIGPK